MVTEEFAILLPRQFLPTSSATEPPLSPDFADCPVELPEAPGIRRTSVILVVASELGIEGLLLLVLRLMAVLPHHSATAVRPRRRRFFIVLISP
jgi:hypothetical protein